MSHPKAATWETWMPILVPSGITSATLLEFRFKTLFVSLTFWWSGGLQHSFRKFVSSFLFVKCAVGYTRKAATEFFDTPKSCHLGYLDLHAGSLGNHSWTLVGISFQNCIFLLNVLVVGGLQQSFRMFVSGPSFV